MSKESYLISCIRRLREYGEGIVLADQSISSLKDVVKSNVYTIISLSQSSQKDRREVSAVMGLDSQQAEVTNRLETGEGIIRLAGRYPYPQLLSFPFVKPKNITEKELDKINDNNEILQSLINEVKMKETYIEVKFEDNKDPKKFENAPTTKIKKNLKRFLEATGNNPYEKSTTILKNAGFSGSSGNTIKTFAINRGYIHEHEIHLGKQGNAGKYFEPTDKAYKLLDELYVEYKKPLGKGSFEHRLFQDILQNYFSQKGYRVKIEDSNEHNDSYILVDVSVENSDGERTAYEIEFNVNQHIILNIENNEEAGYDRIVIVAKKNQKNEISKFIEKNLKQKYKDKVQIKSITEFI